jgi:hypothetical protein
MRRTVRLQLGMLMAAIILLAACRVASSEGRNVIRLVAATIADPFVEAQASAALTQSSFKQTAPVPPKKRVLQAVREVAPVRSNEKTDVIDALPQQRFIRAKLAPAPSAGGRCGCVKKPIVVLYTPS